MALIMYMLCHDTGKSPSLQKSFYIAQEAMENVLRV